MTRCTNVFAHFEVASLFIQRVKHSTSKGLQNVSDNFNPRVKPLLNWKSGSCFRMNCIPNAGMN
ncbi:hypothetical protein A4R26_10905 [Niastella populi]|uniref:Uncharacterized protein n=1 Tax=Niastella populi TaxID=550983 RepID=A0A1V9GC27_9BACT|nr:hypothetical protein A4R26_10905 [Niastella populi]